MSKSGSNLSLSSVARWRNRSKVTPLVKLPVDSTLFEVANNRFIRVIHRVHPEVANPSVNIDSQRERIVLFFFHGVGESADVWKFQISHFYEKGYEIVAPDLLGHGLSSKPKQSALYYFENLAQDILFVFDKFKSKRNVIIGHSYGTSFCILIAKERSAHVSKMVLISGGGPTPLEPESCSPFCFPLAFFHILRPIIVRAYRRLAFHELSVANSNDETIFTLSSFVLRAVMQGQVWPEATEEYHADLIVPVLLVQGRNDHFMSTEDVQWMHETIYGSDLHIVDQAGHMVMLEKPEQVNESILNFLSRDASTKPILTPSDGPPPSQRPSLTPIDVNSTNLAISHRDLNLPQMELHAISNSRPNSSVSNRDNSRPPSRHHLRRSKFQL